jgi:hypothetical protein
LAIFSFDALMKRATSSSISSVSFTTHVAEVHSGRDGCREKQEHDPGISGGRC